MGDLPDRPRAFAHNCADHARYEELSAKAGAGTLTDEKRSLEDYLNVNDFLMIIKTIVGKFHAVITLSVSTPASAPTR